MTDTPRKITLNDVLAVHQKIMMEGLADEIYAPNPLLRHLTRQPRISATIWPEFVIHPWAKKLDDWNLPRRARTIRHRARVLRSEFRDARAHWSDHSLRDRVHAFLDPDY